MALKMVLFWVSVILSVIGINANGELAILHSPASLRFVGSNKIPESALKEVYSAALGLSVSENAQWDGLNILDPFNTPEAIVEVYVDGVTSIKNTLAKAKTYPLDVDEYEPETYEAMKHRILQRFNHGMNRFVDINVSSLDDLASYTSLFGDLSVIKPAKATYAQLKENTEEDAQFLKDIRVLKAITAKIKTGAIAPDNIIDFYYLRIQSLHALSDYHGPNSLQVKEAMRLLAETLDELSTALQTVYGGSVLFTIVTTDVAHTRRTIRAAPEQEVPGRPRTRLRQSQPHHKGIPIPLSTPGDEPNVIEFPKLDDRTKLIRENALGDEYSSDYPAIFNIIFWFSVVFVFALLAVVYTLADMDPGRDSIIYRMTAIRMKKDN